MPFGVKCFGLIVVKIRGSVELVFVNRGKGIQVTEFKALGLYRVRLFRAHQGLG